MAMDFRINDERRIMNDDHFLNSAFSVHTSSFRKLEALAGAFLSILLTFFDSRVARDQAGLFQWGSQISIVFKQRARNTVADSARLSCRSTTTNINQNIKLGNGL